jgi:hypothetical protein
MWMNAPEMRAASIEPGLFVFLHQAVMEGKSSCMQRMSAVLTSTDESPRCSVAPEDINTMRTENEKLRAALHKIAFEPFGPAEASATRVLLLITELARETLKPHPAGPRVRAVPRGTPDAG